MIKKTEIVLISIVMLWGTQSFASSSNQDKDRNFSLKVPVELVIVPVTVENDGKPIAGLQKEDFEILDEGVRQNISYFSADPVPLSVAILIDRSTDNSTQEMIQETMLPLVEAFSAFDEMALFQFEHTSDKIQGFTSSKEDFLKAFKKISLKGVSSGYGGGPFGAEPNLSGIPLETGKGKVPPPKTLNTHIHDAIFAAAQELRLRDKNRRKIIVIISNGQNAPGNRNSYDQTLESVLRTEFHPTTKKNPFGNVLLTDIADNPNRKAAAPSFNPDVYDDITSSVKKQTQMLNPDIINTNKQLYGDLYDSYTLDNSMMRFYSTANSRVENDQGAFSNWLYGEMPSGKSSGPDGALARLQDNFRYTTP